MAAETFAALVRRLHPGVDTRELEAAADLTIGRIAYYLKPRTKIQHIPKTDVIYDLARALGCPPSMVSRSFAADVGTPLDELDVSPKELELVELYRRLSPHDRSTVWMLAEHLDGKGR